LNGSPETRRIALFHPALIAGGIQRVFVNLARGFAERGLGVDLVQATDAEEFRPALPAGVRYVDLHARRALTSLPPLVRYLRRERPQALISGAEQTNVVAVIAKALAGVPVRLLLTEHNYIASTTRNADTLRGRMTPEFIRWFYPRADEVVAVSYSVAEELARAGGLDRQRIRVIYNPVLLPELKSLSHEPLDHPWFRPGEPPVILAVGRLTRAKDYPTLLQAFAELRRSHAARLLVLGEGEERPALEKSIGRLALANDVALPGVVANPYAYMRRAKVFVLSSRFEGLPTVLVEALAVGARVVATDCASGPAEILGTKKGLVPVGNVTALSEAMLAALNDRAQAPPPPALDRFSLKTSVSAYLDLLGLRDQTEAGRPLSSRPR